MLDTKGLTKAQIDSLRFIPAAVQAEAVATMRKENADKAAGRKVRREVFSTKVSEKGCLSVYGLGRQFPTSLYKDEWLTLIAHIEEIKAEVAKLPDQERESA